MGSNGTVKYVLGDDAVPEQWYNIIADAPFAAQPVLHPFTKAPISVEDLAPVLPMALIAQEVSTERWIPIPEPVRDAYRLYRPTPLYRAHRLERALDTPAHIYYKHEGLSPIGSHKPNSQLAQAFYAKEEGAQRLVTMTAAGQSGSAYAYACALFGLECGVYMVRVSYDQKPYRHSMMRTYGAEVYPSPSNRTQVGRAALAENPHHHGTAALAASEAIEDLMTHPGTKFGLGSLLNHVLLHQSVIGIEAQVQMEMAGEYPDTLIACVGAGGNFAGMVYPFLGNALSKGKQVEAIAVEPTACPTLTRGTYSFDYTDTAGMTPIMRMHTLGSSFIPDGIHAGGLRYHGDAPSLCALVEHGDVQAVAYDQIPVFEAAVAFARTEGIVVAPETAHAVRKAIDLALACREKNEEKVILFCLSGVGFFDLSAYDAYFAGNLENTALPDAALDAALAALPEVPVQV